MTVPAGTPAPWLPTTRGVADNVVSVSGGNTAAVSMHGMLHVPEARVDFFATNTSKAQLVGGVVAGQLYLQSSASATGLAIGFGGAPGIRKIVITATTQVPGEQIVTSRAVVRVANDPPGAMTIESWHTS
jgi:hypothetical protein